MLISIIIPTFNEEKVITECYNRLVNVFTAQSLGDYEFLFINDGSHDGTLEILKGIASVDKHVQIVDFSRNFGHQAAVTAGLHECRGDLAIIMDADLQDPPEVIPEMLKIREKEKCNVVYGVRTTRKGENFFKTQTAKLFYRFLNFISNENFPLDAGDFRLVDKSIITVFKSLPERNKYIRGLIGWLGFKQCPVYYERDPRFAGTTKYPLRKMLRFAAVGLFYFSKKPLKLATNIGFLSIVIGLAFALFLFLNVIFKFDYVVTGWTSTIIIIIVFGGVQLLTIGVLGQYIGNLFDEVKGRPEYIISEKINFAGSSNTSDEQEK
ncbi:MAG: glycosyltransferase family 2 protein [Bacteroidetes bacterium]|nr:glycosyltransferase family 2 protein [Bacteroidota bacterium]